MNSDFAMSHGDLLRTAVRAASLRALTHTTRGARSSSASCANIFPFAAAPRAAARADRLAIGSRAQVHKKNSIDHMSRPASTASIARPASQASVGSRRSRATPSRAGSTASRASAKAVTPSWMIARGEGSVPRDVTYSGKTPLQKLIDGDTGPPMIGVSTYPYSVAQKLYKDDFEQMVASSITHPYIAGTSFNVNSAPHDLLEGSALKNVDRGNIHKWVSTYKRDYVPKDVKEAFNAKAVGLRSEQAVFVG